MIESGLFIGYFVALLVTAAVRPTAFLFLLGAALPLIVPRLNIGVGVDWFKIIGPLAIGLAVIRRGSGGVVRESRASLALWLVVYAAIVSLVWMYFEYTVLERYRFAAAMEAGTGAAQTTLKMPVQFVSMLGQFLAVLAVPLWARRASDCRAALLGLACGVLTSVLAGGVYWLGTGLATVLTTGDAGVLPYAGLSIPRLGGLSGEPKSLGSVAALLLIYVVAERFYRSSLSLSRPWWLPALLLVVFLTFSTSAWSAVVLGLMGVVVLSLIWGGGRQLVILFGVVGATVVLASSVGFIVDLVEARLIQRIFGDGDFEQQKDLYVFWVFMDQPLHSIFGFGFGGADLAVTPYMEWLHLKYKRTPTPGVTGVRLLGDLGLVGLTLLFALAMRWARVLSGRRDRAAAAFVVGGLAACLAGADIGLGTYFFMVGAVLAGAALERRSARHHASPEKRPHARRGRAFPGSPRAAASLRPAPVADLRTTNGKPFVALRERERRA
ncbi:MAG: hypothetical protein KIT72_11445 [Polyangiaceae bacterium]|nr:hypothetical protein [Polyangiaceae bacterium]MCW5791027.1 hypothetical protein [Polyangiaceae bacterium]